MKKRGPTSQYLRMTVLRKPLCARYGAAAHVYNVRTALSPLAHVENFSGSHSQDKQNASLLEKYVIGTPLNAAANITKKNDSQSHK